MAIDLDGTNDYVECGSGATLDNIALMNLQGGDIIQTILKYPGITDKALASVVVARELQKTTSMLAVMTIKANRSMSHLRPGDVFLLTWPIKGITQSPIRILEANYGELADGVVTFRCIEDVYKTATAIYATPPATGWVDPISAPQATPARLLLEAPYWTLARDVLGQSLLATIDDDAGALMVGAMQPSSDSLDFELYVRDGLTSRLPAVVNLRRQHSWQTHCR